MKGLDFWRICDEVTVFQAALLIVGEDPGSYDVYSADNPEYLLGTGFDAAFTAVKYAVLGKRLPATLRPFGFDEPPDWKQSTVKVDDLRDWLRSRGIRSGFFFPDEPPGPAYMDTSHPHYAPKLAAAVHAWTALNADPDLARGKSVKQALSIWLRRNAAHYDLTKDDGSPNEQGIDEVSKIANWDTRGGAPKTPGG